MSIFTRSSGDAQKKSGASPAEATEAGALPAERSPSSTFASVNTTPGVVPPPSAPLYSMRPLDPAARVEREQEGVVAEKVRLAMEAQESARERIRRALQRSRTVAAPPPGVRRRPTHCATLTPLAQAPRRPTDSMTCAQAGLLRLAWSCQESGAPIRAIHAYVELLTRYPDTPAADAAVADLVALSEQLAEDGQFHAALAIYDHLEHLA